MRRTEIIHLGYYLPHAVKYYYNQSEEHSGVFDLCPKDIIMWNRKHCKLILKPMSDLTNEKLRADMKRLNHDSHIDWTTHERNAMVDKYGWDEWLNDVPFVIVNYLLENHYDVFGLIDCGEAIDINTINIEEYE